MGAHTVKMPDLGEGITEVEIVAWRVQAGDTVAEDQILADVMTDKATVEIPSPVAGTVQALGGDVGQVLAVGAPLITITVDGDTSSQARPGQGAPVPVSAPPPRQDGQSIATSPSSAPAPADAAAMSGPAAGASPPPKPPPELVRASASQAERVPMALPAARSDSQPSSASAGVSDKPIASPALRRRAWELGVDLHQVTASGAGGRILQADLDAHVATHGRSATGGTPVPTDTPLHGKADEQQQIRVIGLRRRIAQKMQDAKRRIPHFAYVEECDVTELESLRATLNQRFGAARGKLTLLPFLMRAMVLAIADFPQVNARFDDETGVITRHVAVHMGIATQTDAGLMVPVLSHAQDGDLWSLAAGVTRLAQMTRAGQATRNELSGSTITLTSLGVLGGIMSTPIINAPEVAIVGVNRIVERPMVVGGAFVARKMMNLSSSFDHRVVDGQDAAKFIQAVRGLLEAPATLFIA